MTRDDFMLVQSEYDQAVKK
jgi:hypothetical protein